MALGQKKWLQGNEINAYDSIQCIIEWKTKSNIKFTQTLSVNWIDPNNSTAMSTQKIKFLENNELLSKKELSPRKYRKRKVTY